MLRTLLAFVAALYLSTMTTEVAAAEPPFGDYQTSIYRGTLVPPRLSKAMCRGDELCFWDFRTRLRQGAASEGITFGGKYTLVIWGCGTSCQSGAIIDRKTGEMIWLPTASLGYEYQADSTLIIVNPHPEEYTFDGELPDWLYREFYTLKDGAFELTAQDKGDLLDTPHPINPEILEEMGDEVTAQFCEENPDDCP